MKSSESALALYILHVFLLFLTQPSLAGHWKICNKSFREAFISATSRRSC